MQTFLPYPSFSQSAACLDYRRLGKQRVEAKQILQCLLGEGSIRWQNHPAVKMWRGYEYRLAEYGFEICKEWTKRGYLDLLCKGYFQEKLHTIVSTKFAPFIGNNTFHLSHQSNLVRKYPEHYRKYFPNVPNNLEYIWPTQTA